MTRTLNPFLHLIRFHNQSGTLLLLLPSLWALMLATRGSPSPHLLFIFTLGAFLMRSAGVIINDLADRRFDAQVARTRTRPLANGTLSTHQALILAAALVTIAGLLLLFLPLHTALLSPIALILAILYPFTKRFFHLPQFFLGVAFGWGAIMAWSAVKTHLDFGAWLLFGATILWAIAYDTIYALQDRQDDLRIGIQSSAILFGERAWIAVGLALAGMQLLLILAGWLHHLNSAYYLGLAAVTGFLLQQVWKLKSPISSTLAFRLFKQHVWVGTVILLSLWVGCW